MKGTEKQISWAEDIKTAIISTAEEAKETMISDERFNPEDPKHAAAIDRYNAWITNAEAEDSAGFFINNFSGILECKSTVERIKSIMVSIIVNGLSWPK